MAKTRKSRVAFVAVPWKLLNHKACTSLSPAAGQMLPYFLGKVKLKLTDPSYLHAEFSFTYSESERLGCSRRTFYRVIEALIAHGIIDPISKGGLRSGDRNRTPSIFKLSKRWENFGLSNFQPIEWKTFGRSQIKSKFKNGTAP